MFSLNYTKSVNNIIGRAMLLVLLLCALLALTSLSTLSLSLRDAESVNIAGSLRMQSYRMAFVSVVEPSLLDQHIETFERSLYAPSLARLNSWSTPENVSSQYLQVITEWKQVKSTLSSNDTNDFKTNVQHFVNTIDRFVKNIAVFSELKVWLLTIIQAIGFSLILALAWYTVRYTKREVVKPLLQLVQAAKLIQEGHFSPPLPTNSSNELGILAVGVGNMANELGKLYFNLEQKVEQQTQDLSHANQTLAFLHENTQMLQVTTLESHHITNALDRLRQHMGIPQVRLTLNNQVIKKTKFKSGKCIHCDVKNTVVIDLPQKGQLHICANRKVDRQTALSFATMLSKALEHHDAILQQQKLLLIEERTSMARELHDSLAQALSYLKIQVTILKKSNSAEQEHPMTLTINELETGLLNAYEQLRELLSTFRLTVKESNLKEAIALILEDLQKQTKVKLSINYQLDNLPLPASRQIHILQIIREAILNACKHAQCDKIIVSCEQTDDGMIIINICDNGIGLAEKQAAANHYGVLIMGERAEKLNGHLELLQNSPKGTIVSLTFPQ